MSEVDAEQLLELGLLLVVLSAMATIAWRIGLSNAPLFLLAGLIISATGLADLDSLEFLDIAAQVGVILLLLALGLEFSATEFAQSMRRHTPSGIVDFLLNFPPGFVAGLLIGLDWRASLAVGGVTWISSSGIVSKLLSDLGRLGNRETPAVLSILVLEDLAMAAYLPLIGVVLAGGAVVAGVVGAVVAVSLTLGIIALTRKLEKPIDRLLNHEDDEQVLLRVLGVTLVVAGLAELAGISSAIGAFLVGLAIPVGAADRVRVVLRPLRDLFAAVFFLVFGLSTDVSAIGPVLLPAALLALVTAVTKIATGWYAAGRDGVGLAGRLRAGTALVARGEFSVVIGGLAVVAGYSEVGAFVSAYVLIVAMLGPVLARTANAMARRLMPGKPAEPSASRV